MVEVAYGFCHCGCGEQAPIARDNDRRFGWVKGEPKRFLRGHSRRGVHKVGHVERDCGYETPCHIWQGYIAPNGYGRLSDDGRSTFAHIPAWEAVNGPVPDGLELDHLCRNPPCVNPDHLEAVTHAENMQRSVRCVMTPESVGEVRRLLDQGLTGREIGRRLGVHDRIVSYIKCDKRWVGVGA